MEKSIESGISIFYQNDIGYQPNFEKNYFIMNGNRNK